MTTPEANEPDSVWPPAIHVDELPTPTKRKRAFGWMSVVLGGVGCAVWMCAAAVLRLAPDQFIKNIWFVTAMNVALIGGPMLALAGAIVGGRNRQTKAGRVGLVLSLMVLIAMGGLFVAARIASHQWLWFQQGGFDDPCGCDGGG